MDNRDLVEAGVPQGSNLDSLLFLVYLNDLPQRLRCNTELFADDTSLFSTITSPTISSANLNVKTYLKQHSGLPMENVA